MIRFIVLIFGLLFCNLANAESPMGKGTVCFPPSWDGIVAGYSIDKDIVSIYGKGKFLKNIGHGGGRAYIDSTKSIEMIIEIGVDNIIESIKITSTKGRESSLKNTPVSTRINKNAGFGVWRKLRIGSKIASVSANLGQPHDQKKNNQGDVVWIYYTDYTNTSCYAHAEISITFRNGRVYSVLFYNGC